jgi:hypothetical protein
MRTKRIDLDIDYIGGQGSLTIEEERMLSEYFKSKKLSKMSPQRLRPQRIVTPKRINV